MNRKKKQSQKVGDESSGDLIPKMKLPKRLQKIRNALPQQVKMTILTILGFAFVFGLVGIFVLSQFQEVLYGRARNQVLAPFQTDVSGQGTYNNTLDYTATMKSKIDLPHENTIYMQKIEGRWFMFYRQKDVVSFVDITVEHQTVEVYQTRLIWIFSLAAVALLVISLTLSRANMRPIMRSWRQQRTFVADAAHEFKTPMTVIQNNMERMLERPNDTVMDQVESVANTLTEVRHLNQLVGDLLTLAQADADIPLFAFADFDLAKMMTEVCGIFRFSAEERNQSISLSVPEQLKMVGDEQRIRQLLVILIDNALKYAGEDSQVKLQAELAGNNVRILISDTGKGVSDFDKKHLFDRFYRVDKARSRSTGGHGLGLSIAKWVVQGHRGVINVKDTKPHGTTFEIVLPRSQKKVNPQK
ncbi:two-component histidine kinase [Weissella oryzae SG25]|uniref:histidine kinase n=1 Tax=Weissella oryzae (strain DSM 25784 / JCM 18191 / LMG 30913 / SG25) TaxID=1329250 RepID=A0A069CQV2_WEIOS|nr:HAMP domain-containing sensor histidine kinase [Weissella oryzae]GAK30085.1 two-component histidine kinase [Weissella oryzae SG25]